MKVYVLFYREKDVSNFVFWTKAEKIPLEKWTIPISIRFDHHRVLSGTTKTHKHKHDEEKTELMECLPFRPSTWRGQFPETQGRPAEYSQVRRNTSVGRD